jgi:hypothetical protein
MRHFMLGMAGCVVVGWLAAVGCKGVEPEPLPNADAAVARSKTVEPTCATPGCGGTNGCVDSDGPNKYVYGNVKIYENNVPVESHYDYCYSASHVTENVCVDGAWMVQLMLCPNGCMPGGGRCRP